MRMISSRFGFVVGPALAVLAGMPAFGTRAARADAPLPFKDCAVCSEMVALAISRTSIMPATGSGSRAI